VTSVDGLCELTLEAADLAELEAFYVGVFALEVISRDDDRIWLAVDRRTRLGLWAPGAKEFGDRGGRHVHFAFRVSPGGLERIADALRRAGTPFRGPVAHDGADRSIYVEDPAGNLVEAWDYFERAEGAAEGVDGLR
jgi:catechol-2,3-dioxygenase